MYRSSLPLLAQLAFKNHFELRELLASVQADLSPKPLEFEVHCGTSVSSLAFGKSDGVITMAFRDGDKGYAVRIPTRHENGTLPAVTLTLSEDGKSQQHTVDADGFAEMTVPGAFKNLHGRVLAHLQKVLPAGLASALGLSEEKQAKADTPAPSGDAPAPAPVHHWYVVEREGQQDLRFNGRPLARIASAMRNGRQHMFEAYETPSGKFVGVKTGLSQWLGERNKAETTVVDSKQALVPFFGYSALAKALYERLDIATAEVVE